MQIYECTHLGVLKLGGKKISCAILNNNKRIITQTALFDSFNRPRKGETRLKGLPSVIGAKNLIPFISNELREKLKTVHYYSGNRIAAGYDAEVIPMICEVYLQANDQDVLTVSQRRIAIRADVLVRSLAKIGIIALIDEATGYQYEREANGLEKLLKMYVLDEFLKWQSRFPQEYYKELYRLYRWKYNPYSCRRPQCLGKFTNNFIYSHLPPGVLDELRKKNPIKITGRRARRHHQFLSGNLGIPHLEKHITKTVTIMQLSSNVSDFKKKFKKVFDKNL